MVHHVKDISADQRQAIEGLLGRALHDDESVIIRSSHLIKEAPTGEERARLFHRYQDQLETIASRVGDVPDDDLDAAIDEGMRNARHKAE